MPNQGFMCVTTDAPLDVEVSRGASTKDILSPLNGSEIVVATFYVAGRR